MRGVPLVTYDVAVRVIGAYHISQVLRLVNEGALPRVVLPDGSRLIPLPDLLLFRARHRFPAPMNEGNIPGDLSDSAPARISRRELVEIIHDLSGFSAR